MRVIDAKIKHAVELHTDSPALRESLGALSTFYGRGGGASQRHGAGTSGGSAGSSGATGNTLEARRALRSDLEAHGLRLAQQFIDEFAPLEQGIEALSATVAELSDGCSSVRASIAQTEARTNTFLETAERMQAERAALQRRAARVKEFLEHFELTPEETRALHSDPVDADDGDAFFAALAKVQLIRSRCKELLSATGSTSSDASAGSAAGSGSSGGGAVGGAAGAGAGTGTPSLPGAGVGNAGMGIEILEVMAEHQETAFERLYGWVEATCRRLQDEGSGGDDDGYGGGGVGSGGGVGDPDAPTTMLLRSALAVLRERPAYFTQCQRAIAGLRKRRLVDRFLSALTVGGRGMNLGGDHGRGAAAGGPRPIELHAHDPYRYVGDMLAWLHVAFAGEREVVAGLFGAADAGQQAEDAAAAATAAAAAATAASSAAAPAVGSGSGGRGGRGPGQRRMGALARETLDLVFEGVARPLKARLDGLLISVKDLVVAYKLADLLRFYSDTFNGMLSPGVGLSRAVALASDAAVKRVRAVLEAQTHKLVNFPPGYPSDLSVLPQVRDALTRLEEIIAAHKSSLGSGTSGGGGDDASGAAGAGGGASPAGAADADVVGREAIGIDEVLSGTVDPLMTMARLSGEGLDKLDVGVFMLNNIAVMQTTLGKHADALRPRRRESGAGDGDGDGDGGGEPAWAGRLSTERQRWEQGVAAEQARYTLAQSGMTPLLRTIAAAAASDGAASAPRLCDQVSAATLGETLKGFYGVVFSLSTSMPSLDRIQAAVVREAVRRQALEMVAAAYETVCDAASDPAAGYGADTLKAVLLHSPGQIRALLDL